MVLTQIRPFLDTRWDSFSTLARILPFPGTDPDYTIFWYSHGFNLYSILGGTNFRHSHGFYLFPLVTPIMPFFGTHTDSAIFGYLWGLFVYTRTDSIFSSYSSRFSHFRYSQRFNLFSVLVGIVFRHLHGFYLFSVLTRITPFFRTHTDSTIFGYSPGWFVDIRTDSTSFQYSSG